ASRTLRLPFQRRRLGGLPAFFFSSRRRHTRFSRDWSSDVCSSDLECMKLTATTRAVTNEKYWKQTSIAEAFRFLDTARARHVARSEERRVGEGCGSGGVAWGERRDRERGREGGGAGARGGDGCGMR